MRRKTAVILLLGIITATSVFSQKRDKNYFGNYIRFNFIEIDSRMNTRGPVTFAAQDTIIYQVNDYMKRALSNNEEITPVSPIILGVKLNAKLCDFYGAEITVLSKTYKSYLISDTSSAILVALGITKDNVKHYRYRVIENDTIERIPWSAISLAQDYGAKQPYGFIGKFNAPGKQLFVEIQNIKDFKINEGAVLDWRTDYKPVVTEITVDLTDNGTERIDYFNVNFLKMNKGYASRFDKNTGMPLDFKFPVDSVLNLRLSLKNHLTVPYSVYITRNVAGKIDTTTVDIYLLNNFLGNFIDVDSRHFNKPGKYELIIQRTGELGHWNEDQLLRVPFHVLSAPLLERKMSFKQVLPYLMGGLIVTGLLFWMYRRQTNIRLGKSVQARHHSNLQLRSIRAQLNPHFMFNALTSIQNLVNKNDITNTNLYLSHFADLTRRVLSTGDQDLISLEDEIKILDDYLLMEQLRFNFKYAISVDKDINAANIEVPAMLLQPFVENAVKHGISNLRENGTINLSISTYQTNLVFSITDNGKGFQQQPNETAKKSFGLKLSQERIQLLNDIYKEQPAKLNIQSDHGGTIVTITLINWIS